MSPPAQLCQATTCQARICICLRPKLRNTGVISRRPKKGKAREHGVTECPGEQLSPMSGVESSPHQWLSVP
eukprot:5573347-Alexandrium_andersonii.AAC.1